MKKIFSGLMIMTFLAAGLFVTASAFAQDIEISGTVKTNVYGNGTPPLGLWPISCPADGNSVTVLSGGKVEVLVVGGYAESVTAAVKAAGNTAAISGEAGSDIYGAYAVSENGDAEATGNTAAINGGKVSGNVCGGYAESNFGDAEAKGNAVIISGGTVAGFVFGGYALSDSGDSEATGSTVRISGDPDFDKTTRLYGGLANNGDSFSGNRLELETKVAVYRAGNFEYMDFCMPAGMKAGDAMLTINDASAPVDLADVNIEITGMAWNTALEPGDSVTLITNVKNVNLLASPTKAEIDLGKEFETAGGTWKYSVVNNGVIDALIATLKKLPPSSKAKGGGCLNAGAGMAGMLALMMIAPFIRRKRV